MKRRFIKTGDKSEGRFSLKLLNKIMFISSILHFIFHWKHYGQGVLHFFEQAYVCFHVLLINR